MPRPLHTYNYPAQQEVSHTATAMWGGSWQLNLLPLEQADQKRDKNRTEVWLSWPLPASYSLASPLCRSAGSVRPALTPKFTVSPGSEREKGSVCPHGHSLRPGQGWGQPDMCGLSTNPPGPQLAGSGHFPCTLQPSGNHGGTHRELLVSGACTGTAARRQAQQKAAKEEAPPLTAQTDRQTPSTGFFLPLAIIPRTRPA